MVHKWARRIPLASPTTPHPGTTPERSPFWPPFDDWERGRLRADLAREAASIFVAEAIRLGQISPEKTVDDVRRTDLERLADEQEEFLEAVADAQSHVFNPPFVDADGWVRLYNTGDEPPEPGDHADALPIHKSAGATQ